MSSKLRILLADLRHTTRGRHSAFMPLAIGCIATYCQKMLGAENVDIRLSVDPEECLEELNSFQPNIFGLSNYCWNIEVSNLFCKLAKEKIPHLITISGGPNFLKDSEGCEDYLRSNPDLDFYVYNEGETPFHFLVEKILHGENLNQLKSQIHPGVKHINLEGEYVTGPQVDRRRDLDEIPSPYLEGYFDKFFNGKFAPSIQTNRGCPYACSFCHIGDKYFSKMNNYSLGRVKEELEYIAVRMKDFDTLPLLFCDDNWGMYPRDVEIADFIGTLQDKYNWPMAFDVSTGKNHYKRIMKVAELLKNKMNVVCAVQSLNPDTLKAIKRKNLPLDEYAEIQNEIIKQKMISYGEYIVPLPAETKESFFDGFQYLSNSGVSSLTSHTTMLLSGTYLSSNECRQQYGMKTKFRILSRQFGEYERNKCFEIEEVCIATNTISFEDYLECRGLTFVFTIFLSEQFDVLRRHANENNLELYDVLFNLWKLISTTENPLGEIYASYIKETQQELHDSRESLLDYYRDEKNYKKLLTGELGENLVRKYSTRLLLERSHEAFELSYQTLKDMISESSPDHLEESLHSLDDAFHWVSATRDIGSVFKSLEALNNKEELGFCYDIPRWYTDSNSDTPLLEFRSNKKYLFKYDVNHVKPIILNGLRIWGENDPAYSFSKVLTNSYPSEFWKDSEEVSP